MSVGRIRCDSAWGVGSVYLLACRGRKSRVHVHFFFLSEVYVVQEEILHEELL